MTAQITSSREDYLELIYRRSNENAEGIRTSDIARELGCKMPTVHRTVARLVQMGYLTHESRGLIHLTKTGRAMGRELALRHDDLVSFFESVLGIPHEDANDLACQVEHGFSPEAAERLRALLDYFKEMPRTAQKKMREAVVRNSNGNPSFRNLMETKSWGWRK